MVSKGHHPQMALIQASEILSSTQIYFEDFPAMFDYQRIHRSLKSITSRVRCFFHDPMIFP